jgi:hypothetical protein
MVQEEEGRTFGQRTTTVGGKVSAGEGVESNDSSKQYAKEAIVLIVG